MTSESSPRLRFYADLARWWPLVSPVEDYAEEASEMLRVLQAAGTHIGTLLELGAGGGHNAFYMKRAFTLTLTDLSAAMLDVSRTLNPECEHVVGDMRTLDLERTFDAVFVHDAIEYMTTEVDLVAALATAARHLRPGGVALFVPDALSETFETSTEAFGEDGEMGEGIRVLEWSHDPDPTDTVVHTEYAFVMRERDGRVHSFAETHLTGVFSEATWLRCLDAAGFTARIELEQTAEDRPGRRMFLGVRRESASCGLR